MEGAADLALPSGPAARAASAVRVGSVAVQAISALEPAEILGRLVPERSAKVLNLLDWLSSPKQRQGIGAIVGELCERLIATGLPLDRYSSSTAMVTADYDALGRVWRRDGGFEEIRYVSPEDKDPDYLSSPFYEAAETRRWVELWLPDTPDERFGIVKAFKAEGLVHYLCIPLWLTNGANGWITFATKRDTGFSEQDLLTVAFLTPFMMMRIDARVGWMALDKLLRTYVGDEPHQAILAGRAKRGQVTTITAAMLVADLRDSTGHTASLGALAAVDLFNDLFDCLVPPVESRRGEVLKYLGDGLLAIFREMYGGPHAAERALEAAADAFRAIDRSNAAHPTRRPLQIGIALHYGEVAYGNVGSGSRLDFTVIGRDVALATRLASLNGPLRKPVLMSSDFAARLDQGVARVGVHALRGFADPVEIFEPGPGWGRNENHVAVS